MISFHDPVTQSHSCDYKAVSSLMYIHITAKPQEITVQASGKTLSHDSNTSQA